ncbi:tetratricopeptide repeat protein [Flavobacterium sp. DGU11]|uniref:Tetratricopeptide repeat protein n=1 Tax=Flavobacterium arundinis TaxID=3139143 RepID=A0ABU9HXP4_9FLAO
MKQEWSTLQYTVIFLILSTLFIGCNQDKGNKISFASKESSKFDSLARINPQEARRITDEVLQRAELTDNDSLFLQGYYYKTIINVNSGLSDKVREDSEKALKYSDKIGEENYKHKIYTVLGKFYVQNNEYTVALDYYLKARDYFQSQNDMINLAVSYNGLGILYFEMGDYDNSVINFNKAYTIYTKVGNKRGIGVFYANLGSVFSTKSDFKRANFYQKKSLDIFNSLNDTVSIASCMINISNNDRELKNYDSSFKMLDEALRLSEKINNDRLKERVLHNLGLNYLAKRDLKNAHYYFNEELSLSDKMKFAGGRLGALEQLSYVTKLQGRYADHALMTERYYKLKDSVFGSEVKQKIEELKWANEFEKSSLEKKLLLSKYQIEREKSSLLLIVSVMIGIVSVLVLGIVWLFFRNNKKSLKLSEIENERLQEKIDFEHLNFEKEKAEKEILKLRSVHQDLELETKNREITSISLQLLGKNNLMAEIAEILDKNSKTPNKIESDLRSILFHNQNQKKDWEKFREVFEKVHPGFFTEIKSRFSSLTATDIRICAYIRIRMSLNEVASLLNISLQSLHTSRYRIRKKLNLDTQQSLDDFICEIVTGNNNV